MEGVIQHASAPHQTAPARTCQTRPHIPIPTYTRGEERFNAISHLIGAGLGFFALGWMLNAASPNPPANIIAGILIYTLSIVTLYSVSAIYHALPVGRAKRVFRVLDHCTIYLLIAGCYTPAILIKFWAEPFAVPILALEWGLAAVGIAANAIDMTAKPVKMFSLASYVIMGWAVVVVPPSTLFATGSTWIWWVAAGGIAYTLGIVFYKTGATHRYHHCVWHVFVLIGTALQLVGFLQLV